MADNDIAAGAVAGTGKDGRVTKGDVLPRREARRQYRRRRRLRRRAPKAAPAPAQGRAPALPDVTAPGSACEHWLGDRPGAARADVAPARSASPSACVQSQSTAAILTTFNEVNMAPVMDLRNRYKDSFEKEHGVKLGFMSLLREGGGARAEEVPGRQRVDRRQRHRLPRLLRHRHRGRSARAAWWCRSCATPTR